MPSLRLSVTVAGSLAGAVTLAGLVVLSYGTIAGSSAAVRVGVGLVTWPFLFVLIFGPWACALAAWKMWNNMRREQAEQGRQIARLANEVAGAAEDDDPPRVSNVRRINRRDGA